MLYNYGYFGVAVVQICIGQPANHPPPRDTIVRSPSASCFGISHIPPISLSGSYKRKNRSNYLLSLYCLSFFCPHLFSSASKNIPFHILHIVRTLMIWVIHAYCCYDKLGWLVKEKRNLKNSFITIILHPETWILSYLFTLHCFCDRIQSFLK